MAIPLTRRASIQGTQTAEASFAPTVALLENKLVLMLQYDPAKTEVVENQLYQLLHYNDTGNTFGFNSQMYVVHRKVWQQTEGQLSVIGIPIAAPAGAVAATGDLITVTGSASEAGSLVFYVHGERFSISVAKDAAATAIGDAIVTALNGSTDILLENAANALGVVSADCTYGGTTGDEIRITGPKDTDPQLPAGLSLALASPANGAGDEGTVLQDAYDAFVLDPSWKSDIVTPAATTAALDLALTNIGLPDDGGAKGTGLWADADYRPATNWVADIGDYATAATLPTNREADPDNIVIAAPDRMEMPYVIAACTAARCAARWNSNAAVAPRGLSVQIDAAVDPSNDWTRGPNGENAVDTALKAGLAVIRTDASGNSILGDIATCYRPVAIAFPVWQFEVIKRKVWNVGKSLKEDKVLFDNGVFVEVKSEAPSQPLARDEDSYKARVVSLAILWQQYGLIWNSTFTISNMVVEIGTGGNPDAIYRYIPVIPSGNARVQSDTALVDRNIAIAGETGIQVNVG